MDVLLNLLQRYSDNGESTLGLWFTDKTFDGYTLEDEDRSMKVAGETRVPAGVYELRLRRELSPLTQRYRARFPWFSWHVELMDVPGFKLIYVHVGNTDDDTDACILRGDNASNNRIGDGFIGQSVANFKRWYERVVPHLDAGGRALLEIRDESFIFIRIDPETDK